MNKLIEKNLGNSVNVLYWFCVGPTFQFYSALGIMLNHKYESNGSVNKLTHNSSMWPYDSCKNSKVSWATRVWLYINPPIF